MYFLIYAFVFIFGTIIGSFLNVLICRYNTNLSLGGRSFCFSCGKTIGWQNLIPILSYVFQRGRCANCKSGISKQYPIVEFLVGAVFVLLFSKIIGFELLSRLQPVALDFEQIFDFVFYAVSLSILIGISIYDLKHKIIPNGLVYTLALISLVHVLIVPIFPYIRTPALSDLLAGPLMALPFALLWFFSKGRLIGFGDAKLALSIGWMLGLVNGLSSLIFAFWIGGALSLILLLLKGKKYTMKTELPFAPFFVAGAFLAFYFNSDILLLRDLFGF